MKWCMYMHFYQCVVHFPLQVVVAGQRWSGGGRWSASADLLIYWRANGDQGNKNKWLNNEGIAWGQRVLLMLSTRLWTDSSGKKKGTKKIKREKKEVSHTNTPTQAWIEQKKNHLCMQWPTNQSLTQHHCLRTRGQSPEKQSRAEPPHAHLHHHQHKPCWSVQVEEERERRKTEVIEGRRRKPTLWM